MEEEDKAKRLFAARLRKNKSLVYCRKNDIKNYYDIMGPWYHIVFLRDFTKNVVIFHLKLAKNVKILLNL